MAPTADHTEPSPSELADLSALADDTIDPVRRAAVEARIAASPELTALYERERRVVVALRQARSTERAPERLRARIEAAPPTRTSARRRHLAYTGGLAGALAAIALALVLVLPSGGPGSPSVADAAALATRGPDQPAPGPDPARPQSTLQQKVGAVYCPNWARSLGWTAVGARADRLDGREAVTVYYEWHGQRIAYTVVASPALAEPVAHRTWQQGTELRTLTVNGRLVVTWRESGETCVLSGSAISAVQLQALAAWTVPAA
jgi:anti-sigma factor RsiW